MVRCWSLLSQILGLVPRVEFGEIVRRRGAERACKGFSSWNQFVAMLFCQLGQAHSLQEIVGVNCPHFFGHPGGFCMVFKEMGMNGEERTNLAGTFRDAEAVDGGAEAGGCSSADPGRNAEGGEPGRGRAHLPADGRTGCGWASPEASPSSPSLKATASPNASSRPSNSKAFTDGSVETPRRPIKGAVRSFNATTILGASSGRASPPPPKPAPRS